MKTKKYSKQKSLTTETFRQFGCCTAICFALTAPLFYLLNKYLYAEDLIDIIETMKHGYDIPPLDIEQDIMAGMMIQFTIIFLAIILSLYFTLRFTTKKLWHPFDDTLEKTEQFNLAQSDIPNFMETDIYEFARLNCSLKQLMKKDKETYRIQKEFTENASHELQTPLAIIQSKLDVMMQENLTERQMQLVSDIYIQSINMSRLNRNLLLLAKIENAQYASMEDVDIASMIMDSLHLYNALRDGKPLEVRDCRSKHDCQLRANRVLLECMLKNLIVNAIRHSTYDGDIRLIIEDDKLSISNTSCEGSALDPSTLFCRFHKSSTSHRGNGLGLAIVKAICDFHNWNIEYCYEARMHQFTINFHPSA